MSADEQMMQRALQLSMQGRVTAPPNPWVGCVIAKNGKIAGEGFHKAAGQAHAETMALEQAKGNAKGATAYVTLEPCSHFGRTPPCTEGLIRAGIARAVIGIEDPDPRVRGKGIAELKAAGIEVACGICGEEIARSLAPYLHQRKTGLPFCLAKAAVSIDGRVAAKDGTSQWITGEEARLDSHRLRAESQAIIVGAGTAIKDRPRLTIRNLPVIPATPPLRVVLDAKGRVLPPNPLLDTTLAPTLIITGNHCPAHVKNLWKESVQVQEVETDHAGVNLEQALQILAGKGILQVLIEGGGSLLGSFLNARLIQQFCLYIGPRILGHEGIPLFRNDAIETLAEAPALKFLRSTPLGSTLRIDYSFEEG